MRKKEKLFIVRLHIPFNLEDEDRIGNEIFYGIQKQLIDDIKIKVIELSDKSLTSYKVCSGDWRKDYEVQEL